MELRHVSYVVGMSLSACLCTGCMLFPKDPSPVELQTKALEDRMATERDQNVWKSEGPPLISPPPPPSDYLPRSAPSPGSLTAFVEPDGKRVQFAKAPAEESHAIVSPPPLPPESPLVAALRCALQKHPQEAQRLLDKYDKTTRDRLMALMNVTAGIGEENVPKLSPAEMASTLEQLDKLIAELRQRAGLTLDRVCFCRRIDGFGQFEKLPEVHQFQPGSEGRPGDRVHVYAELRNFGSRPNDGMYETTLSSSLRIVDLHNKEVVVLNLGSCVDRCKSRRQDYFLNVQFHVPPKLPAGIYTLHIVVEDQTLGVTGDRANRLATRSLSFRVGAAGVVMTAP